MNNTAELNTTLIETDRLCIRPFSEADAEFVLRLLNSPSFIDNIADKGVRTLDDARAYLRDGPMASYVTHGFGLWRVGLKSDDTPIGMAGLIQRDFLEHVDIGYALLPEFFGQGYAFEAASAVMEYARGVLGTQRVLAIVNAENAASIGLLGKLGFEAEGTLNLPDDDCPVQLFGTPG